MSPVIHISRRTKRQPPTGRLPVARGTVERVTLQGSDPDNYGECCCIAMTEMASIASLPEGAAVA